jgi:hypothetical protein
MPRWLIVAALAIPAGIVLLWTVPPGPGAPYPPCWLHSLTGLHCPGCGATRCLYALVHGDLLQAAAANVLFLISLPFLFVWAGCVGLRAWRGQTVSRGRTPGWVVFCLAALIVLYGVLRNLPFAPFNLLAPHQL